MLRWAGFMDFVKLENLNIEQLQDVKCYQGKSLRDRALNLLSILNK